jgi:hypothetical protein
MPKLGRSRVVSTATSKSAATSIWAIRFISSHLQAGVVALATKVKAVVTLPKGVKDLHGQLSYQLTAIGGPAPNLHIDQQINGGKFKIAGGTGKGSVSWQVTGMFKPKPVRSHRCVISCNVRYWHLADMQTALMNVRYWG